jgi:predicted hydrocarbon binding protein
LLADDFEAGAWNGQATTAVCHWMRGFLSSALSSLAGHALLVSEPECQAKGNPYCRMVFSAA